MNVKIVVTPAPTAMRRPISYARSVALHGTMATTSGLLIALRETLQFDIASKRTSGVNLTARTTSQSDFAILERVKV